jgi:hypothetical protein
MKCGLCGEEIKDGKHFKIYQCKGTESRLFWTPHVGAVLFWLKRLQG